MNLTTIKVSCLFLVLFRSVANVVARSQWGTVPLNPEEIIKDACTDIKTFSEIICALVSAEKGVDQYCYSESEGRCTVTSRSLVDARGPEKAGWTCRTTGATSCPLPDGTSVAMFEAVDPNCATTQTPVCTLSGFNPPLPTPPTPLTCCSDPFIMTSVGCLHYDENVRMNWCKSREYCLSLGTDLFTAENEDQVAEAGAILTDIPGAAYWTSAHNGTSQFRWAVGKGRAVESTEWFRSYPRIIADGVCAIVKINEDGIRNTACISSFYPLCYAFVPAC